VHDGAERRPQFPASLFLFAGTHRLPYRNSKVWVRDGKSFSHPARCAFQEERPDIRTCPASFSNGRKRA